MEHAIRVAKPICEHCGCTLDVIGHWFCRSCEYIYPRKTIKQYWHKLNRQFERQEG
jgi:tRNA(Ile2) C34 agmatinyltransferase TiaS